MKFKSIFNLLLILLLTFSGYAQDINVFTITTRPIGIESEKTKGFVSLSNIDHLNENPDSLALPDLKGANGKKNEKFNRIELFSKYRNRFFSRTNISESDKIFIYSYSKDILVSIPVNELKVVAWLNAYTSPKECPCPEYYYQIGFEMATHYLTGLEHNYTNTFVYVGKENPFVRNQVKPIDWQKIDCTLFPSKLITLEINFNFGNNDYEYDLGRCYKFENQKYQFFIQKLIKKDWQFGLRLLVVNRKTQENIFEKLYYSGESSSFAGIENQWVGNLFKNKPMAIFGFQWHSFGCPIIDFIDSAEKPLTVNCDNRH